jgi:hypothetical protein
MVGGIKIINRTISSSIVKQRLRGMKNNNKTNLE